MTISGKKVRKFFLAFGARKEIPFFEISILRWNNLHHMIPSKKLARIKIWFIIIWPFPDVLEHFLCFIWFADISGDMLGLAWLHLDGGNVGKNQIIFYCIFSIAKRYSIAYNPFLAQKYLTFDDYSTENLKFIRVWPWKYSQISLFLSFIIFEIKAGL